MTVRVREGQSRMRGEVEMRVTWKGWVNLGEEEPVTPEEGLTDLLSTVHQWVASGREAVLEKLCFSLKPINEADLQDCLERPLH